jgi:hypothetical protein
MITSLNSRVGPASSDRGECLGFRPQSRLLTTGLVLTFSLGGFWLRLLYAFNYEFHPDEYISLLAARAIVERGIPVLPSGLLYNAELTFSYLSALSMWLLGPIEFSGRLVGLFFGVLSIPMAYIVGRRIFSSTFVGIAVSTIFTFTPYIVLWGARARRYPLAQLLVLLMVLVVWAGFIKKDSKKYRFLFYAVYLLSGLTSLLPMMLLPPLALAVAMLAWRRYVPKVRLDMLRRKEVVVEVAIFLAISLLIVWNAKCDSLAGVAAAQYNASPLELRSITAFLSPGFDFSGDLEKIQELAGEEPLYGLLVLPAFLVVLLSILPRRDKAGDLRKAIWFMSIITAGVAFEFLFLVSEDWKSVRYFAITFLPPFALLACGLLGWLEGLVRQWRLHSGPSWPARYGLAFALLFPSLALAGFTLPGTLKSLNSQPISEGAYYRAFQFVKMHWNPGDKILVTTTMPPISYWYLGRADYYARNENPYVFLNERGEMADVWVGARWIHDAKGAAEVFRNTKNLWLVMDRTHLLEKFPFAFKQQFLSQTELAYEADDLVVLHSAPKPIVIPAEPETGLKAVLGGRVELTGFALDEDALRAGKPAQLTLFWKAIEPVRGYYKVFVHLRNAGNQNVAQADHTPSESLDAMPTRQWPVGEVIPDLSYLTVPARLPAGEYRLLVGMYDPATSERLMVQGDKSGENAVVLTTWQVP